MSKFIIPENVLYVCVGSKCAKKGGKDCYKKMKSYLKHATKRGLVEVLKVECSDRCNFAPVLSFQPANIWLKEYKEDDVLRLIASIDG
ncbi:MAG: (2Fe-2S) ferredoxin domain-containing protein [Sphingobacteriaceae bacterium]